MEINVINTVKFSNEYRNEKPYKTAVEVLEELRKQNPMKKNQTVNIEYFDDKYVSFLVVEIEKQKITYEYIGISCF